jgi:hypothetical protein
MASHANAQKCRLAAARTKYPDIRSTYLSLAEQWEETARKIEELGSDHGCGWRPGAKVSAVRTT